MSDGGKAIGRVLNIYSKNPDSNVGKLNAIERSALFTENNTENKLKAAGVPNYTIQSIMISMFSLVKTLPNSVTD